MYARATLVEIDTTRVSVDDAVARYADEIVPRLHEIPGFRGCYAMSTPEGKGLVLTLWETKEAADASADPGGFYAGVLSAYVTLFRSPPGRERYEVLLADVPATAPMPS